MGLTDRRRAIVLFGDSLTQRSFEPSGWGAALAHLYGRRCDVYNRGFGGYNTRWCRSMVGELFPADETPLLATVLQQTVLVGRTTSDVLRLVSKNLTVSAACVSLRAVSRSSSRRSIRDGSV